MYWNKIKFLTDSPFPLNRNVVFNQYSAMLPFFRTTIITIFEHLNTSIEEKRPNFSCEFLRRLFYISEGIHPAVLAATLVRTTVQFTAILPFSGLQTELNFPYLPDVNKQYKDRVLIKLSTAVSCKWKSR